MDKDDIEDYKLAIAEGIATLYMDGKCGGTGYQGMVLDGLRTNILNMLDDCDGDVDRFREAVTKVFDVREQS